MCLFPPCSPSDSRDRQKNDQALVVQTFRFNQAISRPSYGRHSNLTVIEIAAILGRKGSGGYTDCRIVQVQPEKKWRLESFAALDSTVTLSPALRSTSRFLCERLPRRTRRQKIEPRASPSCDPVRTR